MNVLILKLGATGDVVRTTPLLRKFDGPVTWITAQKNVIFLKGLSDRLRCLSWEERQQGSDTKYDLVINLEDDAPSAQFLKTLKFDQLFGAYADEHDALKYTADARGWFDLSLISSYGRREADRLKLLNRRTYQDLIFEALDFKFSGERYLLPPPVATELSGDVAISAAAGPVWPMKNWAYFDILKRELESSGYKVNVLPVRSSLLEHLCDVRNHRCLVGGDSLPMHLALGTNTNCVSLFTCTSPWEIHDYGLQEKIISPLLEEFFYKRDFDPRATTSITVEQVLREVVKKLGARKPALPMAPA